MSDMTGYLEGQLADWIGNNNDFDASPGTLHISLHTADEGNNPDGSNEVSASDYDRAIIGSSDISTSGDEPTTVTNDVEVSFGDPTNDWGTITHVGIWDGSSSSDNPLAFYQLDSSKQVFDDADKISFPAGSLNFEFT